MDKHLTRLGSFSFENMTNNEVMNDLRNKLLLIESMPVIDNKQFVDDWNEYANTIISKYPFEFLLSDMGIIYEQKIDIRPNPVISYLFRRGMPVKYIDLSLYLHSWQLQAYIEAMIQNGVHVSEMINDDNKYIIKCNDKGYSYTVSKDFKDPHVIVTYSGDEMISRHKIDVSRYI